MVLSARKFSRPMAATALCVAVAGLPACKSRTDTAQVKSGFKAGGYGNGPSDSLYQALPNQTIAVCNYGVSASVAQNVANAVPYWLAPAGRDKYINVVTGCQGDWIISLTPTNATYYAQTYGRSGTNTTRMEIGAAFVPLFTDRHEMGHVFGFCDLYNPSSCSNNSNDPHPSIMGSGNLNGGQMSQGDVDGIAAILQTAELAASTQAWNAFLEKEKTPAQQVQLEDGSAKVVMSTYNNQPVAIFYAKEASAKIEMQDSFGNVWLNANIRYQAQPGWGTIAGIGLGPKNAALSSWSVRVTTGNTVATGTVAVAAAAKDAGAGLADLNTAEPKVIGVNPVNALDAGHPRLASAAGSDACTCVRAQEAGCGLAKGGVWLSTDFVDNGLSPCTQELCQNTYADVIASQCGGSVELDQKFR